MMNFRRILALILVLCVGVCLCACGENANTQGTTQNTEPTNGTTTNSTQGTQATEPTDDGKADYTVTVLYPDGTPCANVYVMICLDEVCYSPEATDDNGVATFRLAEMDGYKAKLAMAVEGYVLADYIYFESGSTAVTIQLEAEAG